MAIEIRHTAADGTLVHGTARGDGTNGILKSHGFRWFRTLGLWGVPGSRDRQPNRWKIERAADALRAAGHAVTVDVDASHRPAAEVEADRAERLEARADALAGKAARKAAADDAAWAAAQRATEVLPPGGEPIKIGHHSERRHRNAIDRAHRAMGRSVEATRDAEEAARRADVAAGASARRHNPVTVKNRIDKMEADQRRDQRALDGYKRTVARLAGVTYVDEHAGVTGAYREQVIARMAQRGDELEHWRSVYAELVAAGVANDYSRDKIGKGDAVKYRGEWYRVVRVNAKTVTVEWFVGTYKLGYHELSGHKAAAVSEVSSDVAHR